jgi:transposase
MDSSWGKLVQYTTFKAENAGKFVELVNPSGTSQSCSRCGVSVKKSLSVRIHRCPNCGLTIDRDVNAALNILKRVRRGTPKPVQTPGEIRSLQKLEIVSASPIVEPGSP